MDIQKNGQLIEYINNMQLTIVDSGYATTGNEWYSEHVCSPYSRLYYIESGEGRIDYQNKSMVLKPNHIYLIPAGLVFDYACQNYMNQLYFHIQVQTINGFDLLASMNQCYEFISDKLTICSVVKLYHSSLLSDSFALQYELQKRISTFISYSNLCDKVLQSESSFVRSVYRAVQKSLNAALTNEKLAEQMSMSVSSLTKRYKQETGKTLGSYIDDLLFRKAQHLLLTTEAAIGEIADELCFCDQFYFSRYFKLRQDETPSQYRKRRKTWV